MRVRVAVLLLPLVVGACAPREEPAEMANPSAVFCEEQGGEYSLKEGTCTLPDGSVVDAWEYYRARLQQ
jgi:putative hemolysin